MNNLKITICHLYPDLLNLYGDRGNIITLQKRCEWRGIDVEVKAVGIGQKFEPELYDIIFFGGGQDFEQGLILDDLIQDKGDAIRKAVEDDKVFLCICGGYQMMGEFYLDSNGRKLDCLHAVPLSTTAGKKRLIGNIVCHSDELENAGKDPVLVGFENHSGKTTLKYGVKPLARLVSGYGNNGTDGTEGARYKNVYCTYMHGSFLPKNPQMADELIQVAIKRRTGDFIQLEHIDDEFETNARLHVQTCKK